MIKNIYADKDIKKEGPYKEFFIFIIYRRDPETEIAAISQICMALFQNGHLKRNCPSIIIF